MNTVKLLIAAMLASGVAVAQTPPWNVTLIPTLNPLPIGACGAVNLALMDPVTKDVPRNPQGARIGIADFDFTVSGTAIAGQQIDAWHFSACGCQAGAPGMSATITATYPAQFLPAAARAPGVSIRKTATVTLAPAKGTFNPPSCLSLANNSPDSTPPAIATTGEPIPFSGTPRTLPNDPYAPPATTTPVAANPPNNQGTPAAGGVAMPPSGPATPATAPPPTTAGSVGPGANPPVAVVPNTRVPGNVVPPAPVSPATSVVTVNPSGLTAYQGQPGEVLLQWNPVPDALHYAIFGPGLTPGGQRVEQGAGKISVPAHEVPAGLQEWAVASYYPNNVTTPGSAFSRVSINVNGLVAATPAPTTPAPSSPGASQPPPATVASSGKYLVTITGIRVYQASQDDMLSRDGRGDEVYAAAFVRRYDRASGQLTEAVTKTSAVHGDVTNFGNQRLQAGSKSATGGLQDGDMIPDGALLALRSVPAQDVTFPMRVWEGTLADGGDALLISPSLWEQDGSQDFYTKWLQTQQSLNLSLFAKQGVHDVIAQKAFVPMVFGMSGNDANAAGSSVARTIVDVVMMFGGGGIPIVGLLATSADRPLGVVQNGRDQTALPNHVIVLTREIIEAALAMPALGHIASPVANNNANGLGSLSATSRIGVIAPKPGILVVQFQDRDVNGTLAFPERPAIYQMYIQVERVP